jgi:hypothetical protein
MGNPVELTPDQAAARELDILNDAAKRVHTVLCNHAETLARQQGQAGYCTAADSLALIKGGISAIAIMVARMALERSAVSNDPRTVEEYFGDVLRTQFIDTFREVQKQDALAALAAQKEAGGQPS